MILHYDWETTGLFVHGVPSNDPKQPHGVSLSAVLDDDQGVVRRVMSVIVRPSGHTIDERLVGDDGRPTAYSVNGISNALVGRFGVSLEAAMIGFAEMIEAAEVLSAFNHHFDHNFVKIGCARMPNDGSRTGEEIRALVATKSAVCTMESAAIHLIGKKRISLKNAYFDLFKEETQTERYHGSLSDAMASRRIYWELKRRGALPDPKPLTEKVYDKPYQPAT